MSCVEDSAQAKVCAKQLIQDDFAEEFVCKICLVHVVGCGPKLTKCSHLFCGDCLQQWFDAHPSSQTWAQRAKSGGAVPCPVCKTMLNKKSDIYPVEEKGDGSSAFLWRMIQNLKVRCDGRHSTRTDGCCNWIGEYGSYAAHLQSGTCGQNVMNDEEKVPIVAATDMIGKHSLETASTCSQYSCDSSWSEVFIDDVHNGTGIDSEVPHDVHNDIGTSSESSNDAMEAASAAPSVDAAGKDLTSLIQIYVDLEATHGTTRPAELETTHCTAASPCEENSEPHADAAVPVANLVAPMIVAMQEPMVQSNKDQPATETSNDQKKVAEQQKLKTKKVKPQASSDVRVNSGALAHQAWAQAAHQWQAYQWQAYQHQAAQYQQIQKAYAYQYHMSLHAHASQVQQCSRRYSAGSI